MYLIDTNVASELRKLRNGKADPAFAAWFGGISLDVVYLSAISIFEIEYGILLLKRRDPIQAEVLEEWRDKIRERLQSRVIPVDEAIALDCAALNVPVTRPLSDAFIGATARTHGLVLVTRNVKDFQNMGLEVVNPWDGPA
ncbi:type II toxin-antitoxin system VapC family toxin [Rhizobium sp.]|jgi:predicted nucleic acid-binding protein|uniref:type II toxin-antitoxin system VapC family toxin n=1 Tax=Rhizobium sp. TaxID=391 RepID=UPI000DBFF0A5